MIISKSRFEQEIKEVEAKGFIRGREFGIAEERENALFRRYTINEIRQILGFPVIENKSEVGL